MSSLVALIKNQNTHMRWMWTNMVIRGQSKRIQFCLGRDFIAGPTIFYASSPFPSPTTPAWFRIPTSSFTMFVIKVRSSRRASHNCDYRCLKCKSNSNIISPKYITTSTQIRKTPHGLITMLIIKIALCPSMSCVMKA